MPRGNAREEPTSPRLLPDLDSRRRRSRDRLRARPAARGIGGTTRLGLASSHPDPIPAKEAGSSDEHRGRTVAHHGLPTCTHPGARTKALLCVQGEGQGEGTSPQARAAAEKRETHLKWRTQDPLSLQGRGAGRRVRRLSTGASIHGRPTRDPRRRPPACGPIARGRSTIRRTLAEPDCGFPAAAASADGRANRVARARRSDDAGLRRPMSLHGARPRRPHGTSFP